jgi:hypothetical protein
MANVINISTAGQITTALAAFRDSLPVTQPSGGTQGTLVIDVGYTVATHTAGSTLFQGVGRNRLTGEREYYFTLVNGGTKWVESVAQQNIKTVGWEAKDTVGVGICSGTCKDDAASALNGATVTITKGAFSKSATSAAGVYSIADIPADSGYTLTVAKTGYTTASYTVEITENATTTQNVAAARNGSMSGTVTDETGNVEGATVNLCAIDTTTPVLYTATTIANGTYAIASVAVGTYDVWFSKANHVTAVTDDQAVVANTDKVVNKVLLEYGTLTGAITAPPDPEGALVELYTVYPGTPAYSGAAGALPGGTYTIANIAPGTYQIKASLDGYTDKFIMDYVVAGDDDLTLNIDLTAV